MIRVAHILIAASFLLPYAAVAENRIGYVNVNHLIEESPQSREADAQLQEALTPAQRELHQKQEEFEELREKLERDGLVMGDEEREEIQGRLQRLQQELMQGEQVFRQQVEEQRQIALRQVERAVIEAVDEVAGEEGYDIVVSQGVLYVGDGIDMTDRILERMRRHHQAAD